MTFNADHELFIQIANSTDFETNAITHLFNAMRDYYNTRNIDV